jgi:hypothetical protein
MRSSGNALDHPAMRSSGNAIIRQCDHQAMRSSGNAIITLDHHTRSSHSIITLDHHTRSSGKALGVRASPRRLDPARPTPPCSN